MASSGTKKEFTNEQKIWIKSCEPFRINTREINLYDSRTDTTCKTTHEEFTISVENNDIKVYSDEPFSFTVWNHKQWVANVYVGSNMVKINNVYRLMNQKVEMYHTTALERDLSAKLRLELRGEGVLHRLEMRLPGTKWFSMFIFGRDVLTVRTNGDYFTDRMERAFHHVSLKTLEHVRTQKDLKFVIKNQGTTNELVKCHASIDIGTQTEVEEKEGPVTKADVKAAVEEALSNYREKTKHEPHPWNSYEAGAQSLPLQEKIAKKEDTEADSNSQWTYVTTIKATNPATLAIRKENLKHFGGLFDMVDSDGADDERSK